MKFYRVVIYYRDTDADDIYTTNKRDALHEAREALSHGEGSAYVYRLDVGKPRDFGGAKRWALRLLNGPVAVGEIEKVAEYQSQEELVARSDDPYTDGYDRDVTVRRLS